MCSPTQTGATRSNNNQEEVNPRCIVRFRPCDNWKGEYGFDWYREGDHKEYFQKRDNNSNYFTLVGKYIHKVNYDAINNPNVRQNPFKRYAIYYPNSDRAYEDPQMRIQNDCLDKFCKEYKYRGIKGKNKNYFVPVLSLFYKNSAVRREEWGPTTAHVKVLVENGDTYDLKYKRDPDLTVVSSNNRREGSYVVKDVEITCNLTSINSEQIIKTIEIRAYKKGDDKDKGTLAGLLNIVISRVKTVNICIVQVHIRKNGNQTSAPDTSALDKEVTRIRRSLKQAHIIPNFGKPEFRTKIIDLEETQVSRYFDSNKEMTISDSLFELLLREFDSLLIQELARRIGRPINTLDSRAIENYIKTYSNVYKLFFINETGKNGLLGRAHDFNKNEAIILKNDDSATVPHELFHCFGLEHTFDNSNSHTFKALETSNIMDYSEEGFSLWQWQCEQLRRNTALRDIALNNFRIH